MGEARVYFKSGGLVLEGLFAPAAGTKGAVIAHPHPLMGGSMRDSVVVTLAVLFQSRTFSTLRFNFRGVGRSEGLYDNGEGERNDVEAAVRFLLEQGAEDVALAGYSFGALMVLNGRLAAKDRGLTLLVSPPLGEAEISFRPFAGTRGLIVCGDRDPFCSVEVLKKAAGEASWPYEIITGADHFYFGKEAALMDVIGKHLKGE